MSDETATEYVTIRGGDHPRETARALLDAAAELGVPARRVRTANDLGRAVFIVPVEIADAANDRLVAIHAHDGDDITAEAPTDEAESDTEPQSAETVADTPEDEADGDEADATETPVAE